MNIRFFITGAAVIGFAACAVCPANAATVIKDTYTKQQDLPGIRKVNFAEFDTNKDGQLSRIEAGTTLFYIFDTDGNETIDNIEYLKPMVLTVIPMTKQEVTAVDFDDDGLPDSAKVDQEDFFRKSMLQKFDMNKDGLSAKDFLSQVYWQLDDNRDKVVDVREWQQAYIESTTPSSANPNRYNQ